MIKLKNSLGDIRFWIILFFLVRLYGITNPPLEVAHNWRQTTVTMVARNFLEEDPDIFFPRIDIAGEKTGITGMEFPVLNYLIYLVSVIFGYAHWYGRLINLVVSSLGLFYFYKLVFKYFNYQIAFNAAFLLLFSVWFNYSRKIMPDTFSMSFVLAGIYYGTNYFDKQGKPGNLILCFFFILLGTLSKLPSAYLLVLFLLFIADKKYPLKVKINFSLVSGAAIGMTSVYYFYWVPYLNTSYGFTHFFMGKGMWKGFVETFQHFDQASEKFYLEALQIIGFLTFVCGVIAAFVKRDKEVLWIFGICFLTFLGIIFKAGFVFYHHSYYIIPFAPVMSFVAAYAISLLNSKKLAWALLAFIATENILNKFNDYQIKQDNLAILNLERDLDTFSDKKDLILINSGNVPTPMYFAHRRGWVNANETIAKPEYLKTLTSDGLKYIVILKKTFGKNLDLEYTVVFENSDYKIYKI